MVGRKSVAAMRAVGAKKKEEILVNVQLNGDNEIDLVPVSSGTASGGTRHDDEAEEDEDDELSDDPDSDPDLLQTADGRLILDIKRNKCCGKCKKVFKTSAELKAHKAKCPGMVDKIQDIILKERKAAKHANPGEEFHKYCNPNPDNPCYCCGEDTSTAHVGHIRCKFCPKSFKAYEYMDRHITAIHSETDKFPCCYCNARCSSQSVLDEHLKTHDEGKPFSCITCGKDFTRRYHLDRHTKHSSCGNDPKDVEVLPCKVCDKKFTRVDNLREHLRSHMGQGVRKRDYQCPYCTKSFYGSSLLNIHIRTHTGEKPFPCDLCPMSFPSTGALRKHRRKHTGERPYRCDECSAMFAARETLNRHRKTHTGDRPHECQICGKRFIQATQLRTHMFNHTGKDGYECKECPAVFKRPARLTEHVKYTHQGQKPFQCDKCPKTFLRKDDIARHMVIHTGKKPFACSICKKFFSTKTAITLHQKTHSDDGPAQCQECGGNFKRPDCLLRHMRTKHREQFNQILDDTEKEQMQKLSAERIARNEATVEINGSVYQITTMDDATTNKLEPESVQTVEVLDVLEFPENDCDTVEEVLYDDLPPITEDTEVIIGEDEEEPDYVPLDEPASNVIITVLPKDVEKTSRQPRRVATPDVSADGKEDGKAVTVPSTKQVILNSSLPGSSNPVKAKTSAGTRALKKSVTPPKPEKIVKEKTTPKSPKEPPVTARVRESKQKPAKEPIIETRTKRKRESKPPTTTDDKRLRSDEDSIPIFLSDSVLGQKISELLEMLMGEEMLRGFGWPQAPVESVLERVIVGCGHRPAKGEDVGDFTTRMRENTKILFSVTMDDDDIKALLNNHTVDEVIMHVLKSK